MITALDLELAFNHGLNVVKKLLLFAEICFVVISLTFFTGGLSPGGTPDRPDSGLIPTLVMTAIRYFLWTVTVLLLILNAKRTILTIQRDWVLWALMGLVLLSFVWSDFPEWTLLTNREAAQMACFGLYLATRFTLRQQVRLYALTFAIGAIASLAVAIALPGVGRHTLDHPGAWKGIYDYKNTFGSMMVMASLVFFSLPIEHARDRWIKWGGIAFTTVLILFSTSKTALVLSYTMIGLMLFYQNFRWKGKRSVLFFSIGALLVGCVAVGVLANSTTLLEGLGKDATFSGRTYIWQISLDRLWERPWLGYGRSTFWAPQSPYPKAISYFLSQNFNAPHAHNGFIDIALDVGLIGLMLFFISYFTAFAAALKRAYAAPQPEYLWPLGFLTFLALNNMTESYMLRLGNIYWVLFMATVLTVKQRIPVVKNEPPIEQAPSRSLPIWINRT